MTADIVALSTGVVRTKRGDRGVRRYLPGGWRSSAVPVQAFAISHPAGLCLFDAGQTPHAARPGHFPRWHPFFRLARFELATDESCRAQLQRVGLGHQAIRWLVLSHLHTDHVGGLDDLAPSEIVVSMGEWSRATGLGGRVRGYLPGHWPPGVVPRLVDFERDPIGPFSGSLDLTGDGSLVLVPTPGHTPGHMSMLVTTGSRRFLLAGDLCATGTELARRDPAVADFCRRESITVLATHDPSVPRLLADE